MGQDDYWIIATYGSHVLNETLEMQEEERRKEEEGEVVVVEEDVIEVEAVEDGEDLEISEDVRLIQEAYVDQVISSIVADTIVTITEDFFRQEELRREEALLVKECHRCKKRFKEAYVMCWYCECCFECEEEYLPRTSDEYAEHWGCHVSHDAD